MQFILMVFGFVYSSQSRGVCLLNDTLASQSQPPGEGRVHINSNGELVWPVMFLYPEHGQCDYIIAFNENSRFELNIYKTLQRRRIKY